jgi:hypothetical protein
MEGNGYGLHHRGMVEGHAFGESIENSLRNGNVFGVGSMLPIVRAGYSEYAALIAEVDVSASAEPAFSAVDGRIEGDPLADFPIEHSRPDPIDHPGPFVPHDDRRNAATGTAIHPVDIAPADSAGVDADKDFVIGDGRNGDVDELKLVVGMQA